MLNPVIRVVHPDWLLKRLAEKNSNVKQRKIDDLFSFKPRQAISAELNNPDIIDIEDFGKSKNVPVKPVLNTNTQSSTQSNSIKRKHKQVSTLYEYSIK